MDKKSLAPLKKDGKALILAYDHGLEHGPSDFKENMETAEPERVFKIASHEDVTCLAVQKGLAETYYDDYSDDVNLLLKLNGTTSMKGGVHYSPKNCTVERAVELGADALGYTLYPGSKMEEKMFEDFREVQENARKHGLPLVVWAYPRGEEIEEDTTPEVVSYGARIGLEIGADMVKVKFPQTREGLEKVVSVIGDMDSVVSGGGMKTDKEFLEMVKTAVDVGCQGTAVGRNVWKRENPVKLVEALGDIFYRGKTVEEALERM